MVLRILIVDDDEEDRVLLKDAFETIDPLIAFEEATDGCHALALLNDDLPLPDYIFLDLNMPRTNGFQFLTEIKKIERLKDIPVVIYSTSRQCHDKEEAIKLGAIHFISKPYRLSDLQDELHFVLEGKCGRLSHVNHSR